MSKDTTFTLTRMQREMLIEGVRIMRQRLPFNQILDDLDIILQSLPATPQDAEPVSDTYKLQGGGGVGG